VVAHVDFKSGAGNGPHRATMGPAGAPTVLITDLGVFRFDGPDGRMRVESLHPGVTPDEVQERTGFALEIARPWQVSEPPEPDDIRTIRDADPLEVRKMELLSGPQAAEKFVNIYERERQALHLSWPRVGKLAR
jgi:glutaconate CoA-transferase subunit B